MLFSFSRLGHIPFLKLKHQISKPYEIKEYMSKYLMCFKQDLAIDPFICIVEMSLTQISQLTCCHFTAFTIRFVHRW